MKRICFCMEKYLTFARGKDTPIRRVQIRRIHSLPWISSWSKYFKSDTFPPSLGTVFFLDASIFMFRTFLSVMKSFFFWNFRENEFRKSSSAYFAFVVFSNGVLEVSVIVHAFIYHSKWLPTRLIYYFRSTAYPGLSACSRCDNSMNFPIFWWIHWACLKWRRRSNLGSPYN